MSENWVVSKRNFVDCEHGYEKTNNIMIHLRGNNKYKILGGFQNQKASTVIKFGSLV